MKRRLAWINKSIYLTLWLLPSAVHASFIETTIGTAVVNDATASYFNPAALVLLKNSQIIPLGTVARYRTQFTGRTKTVSTGFIESGSSSSSSDYYSPSLYFGMPATDRITFGFAAVSNYANRNPEENSILRYVQSSNNIQDFDFVPAIGIKVNDKLALGAGVNFSYTSFQLRPIIGFPGSNIADSQSSNQSSGTGVGADVGLLLRPALATLIGFNYRSVTTYGQSGRSVFDGTIHVVSNNYHFELRTPARSTLSVSQLVTPTLGIIATVHRIQWSIIRNINIYGIAAASGTTPMIINRSVPNYLRDTWLLTLGGHYRPSPKWIMRIAASYNQAPENTHYQIANGNSYILGGSLGYDINKTVTVDGSYAHAFIQNANINIKGDRFFINGVNESSRDAVSLKVTLNV